MSEIKMPTKSIHFRNTKTILFRSLRISFLAAFLLAACSPVAPTPAPTEPVIDVNLLYANPWLLRGYGNPDNPTVVEEGLAITAEFTPDGQISGFAGCNNYSGSFEAAPDGTLSIPSLTSTLMICEQWMDEETTYLTALQTVRSFSFNSEGRLEIRFGERLEPEQVLIFSSSEKPLTGTNWVLTSYGDPNSPQPAPAESVITAVFSPEGFVSGFSGCNQYNASYTLQENQITLGPLATTRMACATGMETEQAYLQALATATQFEISGQTLTMTNNEGTTEITYTAADLPLEHSLWTLSVVNGQPIEPETEITAIFTPGEAANTGNLSGSAGCNFYSADYTLDGSNLTVQSPTATLMVCPSGMEAEESYLQALQATQSYEIFGDRLVLMSSSGSLMFTADRTPLSGALWQLVSLGEVTNPQPPVQGSRFTAQFSIVPDSPSGVLTGTTGCNEYTAAYAASVEEIKINPPVSTKNKTCVPGLTDQEELYYLALNDASSYRISGNTLVIPYDDDRQALVFEGTQLEEANRPPLNDLNGTTWYLWFIDSAPVLAGTSINATFAINRDGASGTLSGSASCNSYVASFGQNLGVEATLSANQVCSKPAGIMEQESDYVDRLSRAYGYWVTGDQMIINTGRGALTYRTTRPPESSDQAHLLVEQTWYLISYQNRYSVPGSEEPYTLFQANGSLTGYTGCNTFQGTYSTNVLEITIETLASTEAACPNNTLQDQEEAMLEILRSARSYQVVETVMQLVGDEGVLNYSLTPLNRPEQITPPVAIINAPAEATVGQIVTFDANSSTSEVPILGWNWDFGDGVKGTGPVVDHVYSQPGTYRVQMTITDQRGYQDSVAQNINIIAATEPTPVPTQTAEPTVAPTQPVTPTAPPTQPPAPTEAPTQAPQPTVAPTQPVTATAPPTQPPAPTEAPTQAPQPAPLPVLPPQAAIQGPNQGFVGEPITFDASASTSDSGPITSFAWNFGDGTTAGPSPEPSQTTIFNQAGTYQVSVVVTDQNGQSSSATQEVTISTRLNTPVVWILDQLGGQAPLPGTILTLQFLEGQIAGFSGCNTYTGAYSAVPNEDGTYSVTISGLVSTGMACPETTMQQESAYLAALPTMIAAQIQGNSLQLTSPQSSLIYHQAGT
jgi:heat shock protein HslJ